MNFRPSFMGRGTKSTASAKIEDLLHNGHRKELERRLQNQAMDFARQQGLMLSRKELVGQLNDAVALLRGKTGIEVRFE